MANLTSTVPTFAAGMKLRGRDLQTLADINTALLNRPRAKLRQTSVQALTTATATAIQFNAEDVDTDPSGAGGHDNVTNNSRWTAVYTGWYQVSGTVTFAVSATGDRYCWLRVNGTDLNSSLGSQAGDGTMVAAIACQTTLLFLNTGDYVELIGYQDTGGNLNTSVTTREQPGMSVLWASNT